MGVLDRFLNAMRLNDEDDYDDEDFLDDEILLFVGAEMPDCFG